jgi:hypothetical protein
MVDINDVSQVTPGSVLSLQSAVASHSCAQKPTSPTIALMPASAHTPWVPPDINDVPAPTQLQALRLPTTQAMVQMLATGVVLAAEPMGRQKPAQLEAPPSGSAVQ